MTDLKQMALEAAHLVARKDGVLCTRCGAIEPVHPGHGTPMPTLLVAYEALVARHQACAAAKKAGAK